MTLTFSLLIITLLVLIQSTRATEIPLPNHEAQLRLVYTQNSTNIQCTVNAVPQNDSYGYGPSYLLNGFSNKGYWYQIGLAWNPRYATIGHNKGFFIAYEVFAPNGLSVYPENGGGGVVNLSKSINPNDSLLLKLYFYNSNVILYAKDLNTGAEINFSYSNENATHFVGFNNSPTNQNLDFTGVMTEWHYVILTSTELKPVVYHLQNMNSTVVLMVGDQGSNSSTIEKQIPWNYGKIINIGHFSVYFDKGTFITAAAYSSPTYAVHTTYAVYIVIIIVILVIIVGILLKRRKRVVHDVI
ncbi:MAG: hypothetical protein QW134_09130 [Nitrososphaeria archaeon]